jgi:hypothetical protein
MRDSEPIEFPSWIPEGVASAARYLAPLSEVAPPDLRAVYHRLTFDPRMQSVWAELRKCKRDHYQPTNEPIHPPSLPREVESWGNLGEAFREQANISEQLGRTSMAAEYERTAQGMAAQHERQAPEQFSDDERQQRALSFLFVQAGALYWWTPRTVSKKEVEKHLQELRATGRAEIAEAVARGLTRPNEARLIVGRHRTASRLEAYVELLAIRMTVLFGNPLYGVTATITNVVFDRTDFDEKRVRAILRNRLKTAASGP